MLNQDHTTKNKTHLRPFVLWFTGLSGAGKSSIAQAIALQLHEHFQVNTRSLDGDELRKGLCQDLGFSDEDRSENIRRAAEVCKLFVDSGLVTLATFISPREKDRQFVRQCFAQGEFIEVFVDSSLETCEMRDPKGLYRRARAGEIPFFTGIDSRYEPPKSAEIHLHNDQLSIHQAVQQILTYLIAQAYISPVKHNTQRLINA